MGELDWDDVRFFLAVADAGSVGAAAKRLRASHSTVLRRLANLEKKLGARLFKRLPGGYVSTAAGEQFRSRLAGIGDQMDTAHRALAGQDVQASGTVRITTTDTLVACVMPQLAAFRRQYPGIQVQLVVNNSFLHLTRREADIAVRPSSQPPGNLAGRRVGRIQTAVYAARAYWKESKKKALTQHPWVVPDDALAHLAQFRWAAEHVPPAQIAATCDSLLAMVEAVKAGVGIGMLLTLLADRDTSLVRVREPDSAMDTDVWILTHPDLRELQRVRLLTDFLHKNLRATEGMFAAN